MENTVSDQQFNRLLDVYHHDTIERHRFGETFPYPEDPQPGAQTATPGSSDTPARSDHVHALPYLERRGATTITTNGSSQGFVTYSTSAVPAAAFPNNTIQVVFSLGNTASTAAHGFKIAQSATGFTIAFVNSTTGGALGAGVAVEVDYIAWGN